MSKKKIEETSEEVNVRMGVYEVGYLLVSSVPEEGVGEEVTRLKDTLSENGASFISEEFPKLIDLAYEMTRLIDNKKQKFNNGYFGWIKFEVSSNQAKTIKEILDKDEKLIRFILIKTVKENTMSVKRAYGKQDGSRRKMVTTKTNKDEPVIIDEETIDKEIEALVS
jgi:ribosomal protein S6